MGHTPMYFCDQIDAVMREIDPPTMAVGLVLTIARGYVEAERRGILNESELSGYQSALRVALTTDAQLPNGTAKITNTVDAMIDYWRKKLA